MKAIRSALLATVVLAVSVPASSQEPATDAPPAEAKPAAQAPRSARTTERLELETTTITGNRELPKVMYVVPWKRAQAGEIRGRPMQSLLDETLTPVDRDVFNRENRYFRALEATPDARAETPVTAGQPAP